MFLSEGGLVLKLFELRANKEVGLLRRHALVRIGVSITALAIICWRLPGAALLQAFAEMRGVWLAPALAASLAMLAVRWWRWHRLLAAGGAPVSCTDSGLSLFGGFALSLVMPGRLGELGRCLFLPPRGRAAVLLLNVFDRAIDFWALLTCAVASLFLIVSHPAAIFAVCVWLVCLPLMLGLPALLAQLGGAPWWKEQLRTGLRAAGEHLRRVRAARYAPWALVSTALDLVAFYCLLRAFHDAHIAAAFATFPWFVLAGGLPVSVAGLGLREGAATLLLARHGVPAAAALEATLLLFAFTSLLPALIGGVWFAVVRISCLLRHARPPSRASGSAVREGFEDLSELLPSFRAISVPPKAQDCPLTPGLVASSRTSLPIFVRAPWHFW